MNGLMNSHKWTIDKRKNNHFEGVNLDLPVKSVLTNATTGFVSKSSDCLSICYRTKAMLKKQVMRIDPEPVAWPWLPAGAAGPVCGNFHFNAAGRCHAWRCQSRACGFAPDWVLQ